MAIRILHIVGIMNMGGLENLLMNIYRQIDRNQIQFDFLVTREQKGIFDDEIKSLGGKIHNVPHLAKVGLIQYQKNIYNFLKQHQEYRIVHCHRDAMCALYLAQAKRANIPIRIAHSHNINLAEGINIKGILTTLIKKYFMLFIHRSATHYFACSKEAGEWLFGKKVAGKKLSIIRNGIDTNRYIYEKRIAEDIRKSLEIDNETLLIGHVGRFDTQKNHEFILQVFDKVQKELPKAMLCLIGNGRLERDIKQRVEVLGLEKKVRFLGIRKNVNEFMMAFDIFIFPSLFEGLGIVAVEAQATGLKCLVSDKVPEEADMDVGLIKYLSIKDINNWIKCINDLSSNKREAREVRRSDQESIKKRGYDITTTIQQLEEFYLAKDS